MSNGSRVMQCCGKREEFLIQYHSDLIKDFHEYQRNYIHLILALLSGLSIYGIGLKAFLETSCEQNIIFFILTTAGAIVLLLIAYFLSNISSYNFRQSQIIMTEVEREFCIISTLLPDSWDKCKDIKESCCSWIDHPEIFKFFRILSLRLIISIVVIDILVFIERFFYPESKEMLIIIALVVSAIVIDLSYHLWKDFRWSFCEGSYSKKLKRLCEEIQKKRVKNDEKENEGPEVQKEQEQK